ncbi:hypothetical protein AVEN_237761-1 [Araneus ventricosus]|uniref:Uncharacterized protein n=1 Tax=Araneus ventricosus TaxID=182803 RepID=A0A4Y2MTX8_ARAVE|nr:hypothetical protein AVEN_237761-1 [Araneus ventricosus]
MAYSDSTMTKLSYTSRFETTRGLFLDGTLSLSSGQTTTCSGDRALSTLCPFETDEVTLVVIGELDSISSTSEPRTLRPETLPLGHSSPIPL